MPARLSLLLASVHHQAVATAILGLIHGIVSPLQPCVMRFHGRLEWHQAGADGAAPQTVFLRAVKADLMQQALSDTDCFADLDVA